MGRDYLQTVRERVVVFDGGMGATLEQFDLTQEDYGGLQGKCHEALVLNRPDVIEGVHASMVEAGAEVVETDTFQASRLKLDEWGLAEHTLEINQQGRRDRPQGGRRGPLRRRLDRPDGLPARLRRPDARQHHASASSSRSSTEQAERPDRGRRRPADHRDAQDILEVKAGDLRRARGVQARPAARCRSRLGLAAAQRRQDAARHRHPGGAHHARRARRRGDRAQLLDRPRGHARRDPLPRRELARCRCTASRTPGCRCRAPTARRSSPRSPSRWRTSLQEFVERFGVGDRRRLLRHDARAHPRDRASASAGARRRPAPDVRHAAASRQHDDRDAAGPGAARRRSSASASTRRARARSRSCCSPTTTTGSCRSPRTRSRAARTCSTSAWR